MPRACHPVVVHERQPLSADDLEVVPGDRAAGALRLSLGWSTTDADVDRALMVVPGAVARLRQRVSA